MLCILVLFSRNCMLKESRQPGCLAAVMVPLSLQHPVSRTDPCLPARLQALCCLLTAPNPASPLHFCPTEILLRLLPPLQCPLLVLW